MLLNFQIIDDDDMLTDIFKLEKTRNLLAKIYS